MVPNHQAEVASEQELDSTDHLRHWMFNGDYATCLTPPQNPSTRHIIKRTFGNASGSNQIIVTLAMDASPGCGGITWPAGEVLASYLAIQDAEFFRNKSVVELGSGTGLVGIVAGALGGHVWITDQAPLLSVMRENVSMNALEGQVRVEELNWGTPIPATIPKPDLVLAADCVYFEPSFGPLVQTLTDLVHGGSTKVLFCYKKRRKADKRFFKLLKKHFTWTNVTDNPEHERAMREGIYLLILSSRAPRATS